MTHQNRPILSMHAAQVAEKLRDSDYSVSSPVVTIENQSNHTYLLETLRF